MRTDLSRRPYRLMPGYRNRPTLRWTLSVRLPELGRTHRGAHQPAAGLLFLSILIPLLALTGCGGDGPLASNLLVEPSVITPDGDGDRDVARIAYDIGAPAVITLTLTGDAGEFVLRDGLPRSPGPHEALFGGTVEGRMVPAGEYQVTLTARPRDFDAAGGGGSQPPGESERIAETAPVELTGTLAVESPDIQPPAITAFEVVPNHLSPNQDGIDDRVDITYHLGEDAEVQVWLETDDGQYVTDIIEEEETATLPGEAGRHYINFDAGVDADAPPPPDGLYRVVVRAVDRVGNVAEERRELRIEHGGLPRAAFRGDVDWSDTVVPLGDTLEFAVTVRNVGGTPLRTRGPAPAFVYDSTGSFNQSASDTLRVMARSDTEIGDAQIGIVALAPGDADDVAISLAPAEDADAASGAAQPPPARLATDTTAETDTPSDVVIPTGPFQVCGQVLTADGRPAASAEVFAFEPDGDGLESTTTDDAGQFCLSDLIWPPDHERTFARSSGAFRVGLNYDARMGGLDWPFRWQVGPIQSLDVCEAARTFYLCLMPGAEAVVTGGVRFVEPPLARSFNVYLGLLHEDVRLMDGPYGVQRITVEY